MSALSASESTAARVAERIRAPEPWEVFAERSRRYEVHLNGTVVELIRGPIVVEGYGIRLLRSREGQTGRGFQASTDLSDAGVRAAVDVAERVAQHSVFPAKDVALPSGSSPGGPSIELVDADLWTNPMGTLDRFVAALTSGFEGRPNELLSFGSVRGALHETSIANSSGLRVAYRHTEVEYEAAVKGIGGPEGPPPGEYWVNGSSRKVEDRKVTEEVPRWCTYAQDVRRAVGPPTGDLPIVLPPSVLSTILPIVLGVRLSGGARLRQMAPTPGAAIAAESVTIYDDGRYPWAEGSAPVDDEGTPRSRRPLVRDGKVGDLLYDALHGAAFNTPSTGSASRVGGAGLRIPQRFLRAPTPTTSTIVVEAGTGGTDAELVEAAGEGIWVQQLGWAFPDPLSGAFGGEIRIGYRIRGGKLAEPVRGGTVGGIVMAPPGETSMLTSIAAVGSTAELCGELATPSILVRPLVVAGE